MLSRARGLRASERPRRSGGKPGVGSASCSRSTCGGWPRPARFPAALGRSTPTSPGGTRRHRLRKGLGVLASVADGHGRLPVLRRTPTSHVTAAGANPITVASATRRFGSFRPAARESSVREIAPAGAATGVCRGEHQRRRLAFLLQRTKGRLRLRPFQKRDSLVCGEQRP